MKFLDPPSARLALGFAVPLGALLLGVGVGHVVVSQGAQKIGTQLQAQNLAMLIRRSAIASAKAVDSSKAPGPAPTAVRTSVATSGAGQTTAIEEPLPEVWITDVAAVPLRIAEAPQATRPVPPLPAGDGAPTLSLLRMAGLQLLTSLAALLVGFVFLGSILYLFRRIWGVQLRLEVDPSPFSAAEKPSTAEGYLRSDAQEAPHEHERRQRAQAEQEMVLRLCQQNLFLHRTLRQQAGPA